LKAATTEFKAARDFEYCMDNLLIMYLQIINVWSSLVRIPVQAIILMKGDQQFQVSILIHLIKIHPLTTFLCKK